MTDTPPTETATIELHYDSNYRKRVIEEQYLGSWLEVTIVVGDTQIYGHSGYEVAGSASGITLQLLESVDTVFSDKRYIIEFESGPSWLVVEPWEDDLINIVNCATLQGAQNPEKRLDIDTDHPITKQGWANAVIETARDFREAVLDLNPDLHNHAVIEDIHQEIKRAEALVAGGFDLDPSSDP